MAKHQKIENLYSELKEMLIPYTLDTLKERKPVSQKVKLGRVEKKGSAIKRNGKPANFQKLQSMKEYCGGNVRVTRMYNSPPIEENQDGVAQLNQQDIQLYKTFEPQRSHNEQDLRTQQQFQQQQQDYGTQQQLEDWMKPKSQFQDHTLNEGDVVKNTADIASVQGYSLCLWNENCPSVNPCKTEIILDATESSNSTVNGASDEL
ncbi:unnamed protein product [Allacma fusca]|uniref:Uncharacterized protein n=1 Tax=Allacma fusca TaxID=39272 RepID=A0A8J2L254_9HEXA|nr:unnamed protein product [Allacma fusca]